MSDIARKLLVLTVFYGVGLGLVWWGSSWKTTLGVFVVIWANNIERRWRE